MAKYRQWFSTGASGYVEVEADSPEEAEAEIEREYGDPGGLCAHCSGGSFVYKSTGMDLGEWEVDETVNNGQPELVEE